MADVQLEVWERFLRYRRTATRLMAVCAIMLAVALVYGCSPKGHWSARSPAIWSDVLAFLGGIVGFLGLIIAWATRSGLKHTPYEVRWHSDRRRGTVSVRVLRPGPSLVTLVSGPDYGTGVHGLEVVATGQQQLICGLDVRVAGVPETRADYIGAVGPLDAPRFVDGAVLACQVNPAMPERVRIWPHADPKGGELAGSFLDFKPV